MKSKKEQKNYKRQFWNDYLQPSETL